jgi:hypothetical protein
VSGWVVPSASMSIEASGGSEKRCAKTPAPGSCRSLAQAMTKSPSVSQSMVAARWSSVM